MAESESPPAPPVELLAEGHPARPFFQLLGRSYAAAILTCLATSEEPWRFTELEETLEVSTNTLSKRLDELTEAGLVDRRSYDEIPPHVEYRATEKARDLEPVFEALHDWAETHVCDSPGECRPIDDV